MLFEKTLENKIFHKPTEDKSVIFKINPKRKVDIKRIKEACKVKNIRINDNLEVSEKALLILSVDVFINYLKGLTEEEALEYLKKVFNSKE